MAVAVAVAVAIAVANTSTHTDAVCVMRSFVFCVFNSISSPMNEEEEILLLALAMNEDEAKQKKKRRKWVHEINAVRETKGEFHNLFHELRNHEERFYVYFRMTKECFDELLELIKPDITKEFTNYRQPIEPAERLAVTLRYLATGDSCSTIGHSFRMGFRTVSVIVLEVCCAIWNCLQSTYMPEPTKEIWESTVAGFSDKWQFPNCIGSIDGKHITIKCPNNSGSNYFCYLQKFSIVLLAIVDHDYKFICIDVGGYGKNSDGGLFEASSMGQRLANKTLNVPEDRPLPNQAESTPCVLVGDEAFPLREYLMRPFSHRQSRTDDRKEKFNKMLCRARRVVENAFGILSHKWRVLHRPIEVKVDTTIAIVKAICILHNYLRSKKCDELFMNLDEDEQVPLAALQNLEIEGRRATNASFQVRERFVSLFDI